MELTLEQALQKGIEAHKAGQVQDADRYYTAILKANPKHPDANHNMGVLAVGVGKVETALPFFKAALETNPSIAQYWLSYIDALIKLDRITDAKAVFNEAKSKGAKGDGFDQIEKRLENLTKIEGNHADEEILKKAVDLRENGKYDEAIGFLKNSLSNFPADPNIPAILSHCYILKDDLEQAEVYLDKAKKLNPNIAAVGWNQTRLLLKQNKLNEALAVAEKTNKLFPDDLEGMVVLGSCFRANGNFDEGLKYLHKAVELDPNNAEALINRALINLVRGDKVIVLNDLEKAYHRKPHIKQIWHLILNLKIETKEFEGAISLGEEMVKSDPVNEKIIASIALCYQHLKNYEHAVVLYNKALVIEPNFLAAWVNLGAALREQGRLKEAIEAYNRAISIKPNYAEAYNNMGVALKDQDKLDEAIKAYKNAISIKPDYTEAYNNIGVALKDQDKLDKALEAYKKAISIKPDYANAYTNMGNALREQGKLGEATEAYKKAISIKPDYAEAYYNMGIVLKSITFNKPNRDLQKIIVSLLDRKTYARPSDIASAAISLLKFEPSLQKCLQLADNEVIESPTDIISELSELSLLVKLMSICPLPDLGLENLFRKLRSGLLLSISDITSSPELLSFQSALALQCFTNEYIYNSTEEEEKAIGALSKIVKKSLDKKKQPSPQIILTLASYKALNEYDWCKLLDVTDDIKDVCNSQVAEPNEEEKIKQHLPKLEKITDKVSSKVRDQYEESPYPRWVNLGLPLKPLPISNAVDTIKLKLHSDKISEVEKPEILIAGCGTGQHSIGTASRFKDSKVLAIDLSLSSLAYAKRKTNELGVENIDYMQADILDLRQLNTQFDIIESVGVLHHMDDSMAGWKVLTDCLKPGGLMKIGLYSDLARQNIVKMRKEISQIGIGSSHSAMKSFRKTVMVSDQNHHKRILNTLDFYSLSTLKDLLFHVQEHRFTLPQIQDCLNKLGLKFCGFGEKNIVSHFTQTNKAKGDPYDLDKWQAYEEANPNAFAGMYQFWCQKAE